MMSRDIVSGFLNTLPTFLESPCAIWTGDAIPAFLADLHNKAGKRRSHKIDYMLFAPEGSTLPNFFDPEDPTATEYCLPSNGGSIFVKEIE